MNKIDLKEIDTIIFDLGMVIINLEIEDTTKAFKSLLGGSYESVITKLTSLEHFEKYETGRISSEEFITTISEVAQTDIKAEVPIAWNAMLKNIPDSRFRILNEVKKNFRTFCLSNTNEMHIEWIYDYLKREKKIENLDSYFEKVYLSHEIGMRKPDREIYDYVLSENSLQADRTLFIDDTKGHLEGAEKCGIKTFHLTKDIVLEDLF